MDWITVLAFMAFFFGVIGFFFENAISTLVGATFLAGILILTLMGVI